MKFSGLMNKETRVLLILATLMSAPIAASAQAISYDFTGTVTEECANTFSYPIGTAVTGTYIINLANLVPSQSDLPISTTKNWYVQEYSGSAADLPPNGAYVFASTLSVANNLIYSTSATPGAYVSSSLLEGFVEGYPSGPGNSYQAVETQYPTSSGSESSGSQFVITNPGGPAFSITGLPIFARTTSGSGRIESFSLGDYLCYDIASLILAGGPPVVGPEIAGTLGTNGWYISATTLTWIAVGNPEPSRSGCEQREVPDTRGTQYTCSAANSLGSAAASVTIKKDSVAPRIAITKPANNANYKVNQNVVASYTCTDGLSGIASCAGTVPDGTSIPTVGAGTQTFSVVATDNAGNESTKDVTYNVESPTAKPVFSLKSGTYAGAQPVTISDTTAEAMIYYTLDGTTPTTSSLVYSGVITIDGTETLKADAIAAGYTRSTVSTASYTIR
jgi:hypothetical protein